MQSGFETLFLDDQNEESAPYEMLTLRDLKQLVKKGEGYQLEFKMKVKFPEKIVREMVAFANSNGGTLLLGVGDLGEIAGLQFPDEDQFVMDQAIEKFCFPAFSFVSYKITLNEQRSILVYQVFPSLEKPHFVQLPEDEHPKCFVRNKDKSIQATKEMKQILRRWDEDGIQFTYGEAEKLLITYLQKNQKITLKEFEKLANLPTWLASRKLVLLVLTNVLHITPEENFDTYSLK